MKAKSIIEETFAMHCNAYRLAPVREHKFHPDRKWRFDFAWPDQMIAAECEGGIWTGGRHTRGAGVLGDMEKYNQAALLGWAVFRFDGGSVEDGSAVAFMVAILKSKQGKS